MPKSSQVIQSLQGCRRIVANFPNQSDEVREAHLDFGNSHHHAESKHSFFMTILVVVSLSPPGLAPR